ADSSEFWVAAERLTTAQHLYPESELDPVIPSVERSPAQDHTAAVTDTVRGWMESTGPSTASALAERLAVPRHTVDTALARLEAGGQVLRGRFTPRSKTVAESAEEIEWCNRRLLARIHRLTLGRLRREIAPVTTFDFLRF